MFSAISLVLNLIACTLRSGITDFQCICAAHTQIQPTKHIYAYSSAKPEQWTSHLSSCHPSAEQYKAYATHIEEKGKKAAFAAKGTPFTQILEVAQLAHIERTKKGFIALGQKWPAGEIDEVANRYIEYTIAAEKKKGLVIETITVPIRVKGGTGMNIHINYGFGEQFTGVTTIYENTALPQNKTLTIRLDQPILVPTGQTLHLRILPWYDSNGRPQGKKYIHIGELQIIGKRLK